jgi:hypothetical protein
MTLTVRHGDETVLAQLSGGPTQLVVEDKQHLVEMNKLFSAIGLCGNNPLLVPKNCFF